VAIFYAPAPDTQRGYFQRSADLLALLHSIWSVGMTVAPSASEQMMQMITGYWVSQVVRGAAYLSLADHLEHGLSTADEIAKAEGANPDACARLLRACEGLGMVQSNGKTKKFTSTDLLQTLNSRPGSLRGLALALGEPGHWLPWGRFTDVLKSGEPQAVNALGMGIFEYYKTAPQEAAAFTAGMSGMTAMVSSEVVRLLDTKPYAKAIDVGAAAGALIQALLLANPKLHGISFDRPNVVDGLATPDNPQLDGRLEFIGGDFFQDVPASNLYLLKHVLHDWGDEDNIKILRSCRRAALPGARLAVIEMVIELGGSPFPPIMDMTMMVMGEGRERTLPEYQKLFSEAGFGTIEMTRTATPYMILTADAI
jgi:hypothetical protein